MKLVQYFKDTIGELKHVTWPTTKQAINYTILVVVLSVVVAVSLGLFDYLFTLGLEKIIAN